MPENIVFSRGIFGMSFTFYWNLTFMTRKRTNYRIWYSTLTYYDVIDNYFKLRFFEKPLTKLFDNIFHFYQSATGNHVKLTIQNNLKTNPVQSRVP